MNEELIVRHCAPTLAGMKAGSLFSCPCESACRIRQDLHSLNRRLREKGVSAVPLRIRKIRALIYLYRPNLLETALNHKEACGILSECGYDCSCPKKCLARLYKRLQEQDDFPHEVGLFLGYPPEDVRGFIENRENAKCVGNWKVYGDEASARAAFAKFRKCTDVYLACHKDGRSLEKLTVGR